MTAESRILTDPDGRYVRVCYPEHLDDTVIEPVFTSLFSGKIAAFTPLLLDFTQTVSINLRPATMVQYAVQRSAALGEAPERPQRTAFLWSRPQSYEYAIMWASFFGHQSQMIVFEFFSDEDEAIAWLTA